MAIKEESLKILKERVNVVEVVREYVELKKNGTLFKGLCPFHEEKTPSFTVKPDHFHCYGCSAHGDAIDFVLKKEGGSFNEVAKSLAEKYGVTLEFTEEAVQHQPLLQALKYVDELYQFYLLHTKEGHKALKYLHERGFSNDDVKCFGIGLVPPTEIFWGAYNEKYSSIKPRELGVLVQAFEDRISFPISDYRGKTVGFSCRKWKVEKEGAKYVNSCDTDLFKKNLILYGLSLSRKAIAKEQVAILCEGQTDVISVTKAGLQIAVASLGTAFNKDHVSALKRAGAEKVCIAFDGDKAGHEATIKVGSLLQQGNIEPLVLGLPDGYDCDSYIQEYGSDAFVNRFKESTSYIDLIAKHYLSVHGETPNGKSRAFKECEEIIDSWENKIVVRESKRELANALGVDESASMTTSTVKVHAGSPNRDVALQAERTALCAILVYWGKTILLHSLVEEDFINPTCKRLFSLLKANKGKSSKEVALLVNSDGLRSHYDRCMKFAPLDKIKDAKQVICSLRREVTLTKIKVLRREFDKALCQRTSTTDITREIKRLEGFLSTIH